MRLLDELRAPRGRTHALLLTHSAYLVGTGVWSVAHRRSFERVSGRKRDFWLVRTVGGLATVIGLTLGKAALDKKAPDARVLAVGSAVVFAAADVHAARNVSRVYLGDLLAQPVFAAAWLRASGANARAPAPPPTPAA